MSQNKFDEADKYRGNIEFPGYQDYQLDRLLPTIKMIMIIGVVFILLFSIVDIKEFPQFKYQILLIRFLVILPILLIFIFTQINQLRSALPNLILVFGIISFWTYVYLHTILDGKVYFLLIAYIYYSLVIVSLAPLYSKKTLVICFIVATVTLNIAVVLIAIEYREYLFKLMIRSIGAHVFALIVAFKIRDSQLESYNFALLIHKRSMLDSLTKVYNRHGFDMWIHENLEPEDTKTPAISIIMLDIDDFKKVNDQYGHQMGDLVIKNTAETITSLTNKTDCVVRFGGEEFVVLLRDISSKQCFDLAEKIREAIASKVYQTDEGVDFNITVSVGVSTQSDEKTSLHELIGIADKNLYIAKSKGKNRVVGY